MVELKTYKMVDEKYCTDCVCVIPSEVYLKKDADSAIAELKQKLYDAGMRERKLKRALWLARAKHAQEMAWNFHEKNLVEKCAKWDNVHLMCRAKAEEHK